jgi:cell surface protein SprA
LVHLPALLILTACSSLFFVAEEDGEQARRLYQNRLGGRASQSRARSSRGSAFERLRQTKTSTSSYKMGGGLRLADERLQRMAFYQRFHEEFGYRYRPDFTAPADTGKKKKPIFNRRDSNLPAPARPADPPYVLDTPPNIEINYELAPDGKGFYVYEQVGGKNVRPPTYITYEQYMKIKNRDMQQNYLRSKAASSLSQASTQQGGLIPTLNVNSKLFATIFGSNKVDIKPNISVLIDLSVRNNTIANPALTLRQQNNTNFNFNQQIQMNIVGSIGEKLKLRVNYDTQATFNFENQFKINYEGQEDDIIKSIEAGNVSMPINGSLISGGQNLWGVKVKMQLGPVFITALGSQQRGKTTEVNVQGGSQVSTYTKKAAEYDDNRHFFLSHQFRANYERALVNLPQVNSRYNIVRADVWVTNRASTSVQNNRNAMGFVDLAENSPTAPNGGGVFFNDNYRATAVANSNTDNASNALYQDVATRPDIRKRSTALTAVQSQLNLTNGSDFEYVENMRKLSENEYTINRSLGYVTLNQKLQPNDVLFVAYEYTIIGDSKVYKVGELTTNEPLIDSTHSNLLFLKMLKPSAQRPSLNNKPYPTWDLMMKNIYSIGGYNLKPDKFKLDITYESTEGAGDINYMPGSNFKNVPLMQIFGIDSLTNGTERGPDNRFDYVPGITVLEDKGVIIFPKLEPFGAHLVQLFKKNPNPNQAANDSAQFAYPQLYRLTQVDAIQYFPQLNRYKFDGQYAAASSSEIQLNAVQIAPGSVKVTAGGIQLQENIDYQVDYQVGKVTILNPAIISSGQQVKVTFETNTLFGIDQKTLVGVRIDYKLNKDIQFGATLMHLNERPLINKIIIGEEPVSNTIWGIDAVIKKDVPFLTRLVDLLPFYSTKEKSTINLNAEFAQLIPGLPSQIQTKNEKGIAYIDDFEGTRSVVDLGGVQNWKISSFPPTLREPTYSNDPRRTGFHRAKLAWYFIDPSIFDRPADYGLNPTQASSSLNQPYTRRVEPTEVFPNRTVVVGSNILSTFDLRYMPKERGPYNFVSNPIKLQSDGTLSNPEENWAGIMRRTTGNTDFEAANFEFIEFWVMDPFLGASAANSGGDVYFNLGKISEDVLRDNRRAYENGLPTEQGANDANSNLDITAWGRVSNVQTPTTAFDNSQTARTFQDVGLDGLRDEDEATFYAKTDAVTGQTDFLTPALAVVTDVTARNKLQADPSADNFTFFRDFPGGTGIGERYLDYNGQEGNSATNKPGEAFTRQATPFPDVEDLNQDGSLNTAESFYEYKISMRPADMVVGKNYIVDVRNPGTIGPGGVGSVRTEGGISVPARWYQFRIPLKSGTPVNGISDFKAIDFVRLYMTGFRDEAVVRFGAFNLVATQWRTSRDNLNTPDETGGTDPGNTLTTFDIGTVTIEDNGTRLPFNYKIPPNIQRQSVPGSPVQGILQNEQSLAMRICDLADGDSRGIFRNINLDLRNYTNLKMWVHAEANNTGVVPANFTRCGQARIFLRLGTDGNNNYYEYEKALCPSDPGDQSTDNIWRGENQFEFKLEDLNAAKSLRNAAVQAGTHSRYDNPYEYRLTNGDIIRVVGTPLLNNVKTVLVGVRNPKDDGLPICMEVWINELRVTDFNQTPGYAANIRLNVKFADLMNFSFATQISTPYFGGVDKKINDRQLDMRFRYDIALNLNAGKLLPVKAGLEIPFLFTWSENTITPRYNPLDPDIQLKTLLETLNSGQRNDALNARIDYTRTYSYAFTNVRKIRTSTNTKRKPMPWDIENISLSYAYNERYSHNAQTQLYKLQNWRFGFAYAFALNPKPIKPWTIKPKEGKKLNSFYEFVNTFNFTPYPKSFSFRLDGDRTFEEQKLRPIPTISNKEPTTNPTYQQNFLITRSYNLQWDLFQSLNFNFTATNISRVDEPRGNIDTKSKRDTLLGNLFSFGRRPELGRYNLVNMGRNISYQHNFTATYRVPFDKFKPLNFINLSATYAGNFQWRTASIQNKSFGNTVVNGANLNFNGQLNMAGFYKKFPWIQKILKPIPKRNVYSKKDSTRKKGDDAQIFLRRLRKQVAELILSVQTIDVTYSINQGTTLPGYMPRTEFLGLDFYYLDSAAGKHRVAPAYGLIAGWQPDLTNDRWLRQTSAQGVWSRDPAFATPFNSTVSTTLNIRAALTLFKGFRVDLNASRQTTENWTGIWSNVPDSGGFRLSNQALSGSFSMSIVSLRGMFEDPAKSGAFRDFENNRLVISDRLRNQNTIYNQALGNEGQRNSRGYWNGYTGSSPDVLIPAFLAAYGPYNASNVGLNPFPAIPIPNWSITYTGLTDIPEVKNIFKVFSLRHKYSATYTLTYNLNLNYKEAFGSRFTDQKLNRDTSTVYNNPNTPLPLYDFESKLNIQTITITESFAPLIGVQMELKYGISAQIEYKRNRTLIFNVPQLQLNESSTNELTINVSYRRQNFLPSFTIFRREINLKGAFTARFELTLREVRNQIRYLDSRAPAVPTGGNFNLTIKPSLDYAINTNLTIRAYVEYNLNKPVVSTSFPTSFTAFGLQVRFNLTQ